MDQAALAELRTFAVQIAREAGALTLEYFRGDLQVETKADQSPVTIADRRAEELLRRRIGERYPDHGILGEEFGEQAGTAPGRWILDPIDGTFPFVCGVPLYCNLIGFEWRGEMLAGVINLPAIGEIVHAARGQGCQWNERPARVSPQTDLAQARLACTSAKHMDVLGRSAAHRRLRSACGYERGWSDGYGYALVATGRIEVMVDPIVSIWDVAALKPVVEEAGGRLTDWAGVATHEAREVVATNGGLHAGVLALLRD